MDMLMYKDYKELVYKPQTTFRPLLINLSKNTKC